MHHRDTVVVDVFEYPDSGRLPSCCCDGLPEVGNSGTAFPAPATRTGSIQTRSRHDRTSAASDTSQNGLEAAREQGIREGREQESAAQKARTLEFEKQRIAQSSKLAAAIIQEQQHFFEAVEPEVVRLALAIAERVLRREAQIDPLFLLGSVRVALGHLADSVRVRLRIPFADAELWKETMARIPNLRVRPEIVPDQAIALGDCRIESEMGSVDLGLCAELQSIRETLLDGSESIEGGPQHLTDARDKEPRA